MNIYVAHSWVPQVLTCVTINNLYLHVGPLKYILYDRIK
jgi:hypothetical protein